MKLTALFLFSFSFLLSITSQNTVTLYGTISHPKDKVVYVKYYKDYISYDEVIADSARLDKKGNYMMQFKWEQPYPATFYHGDEITEMYLSPNDSLRLTLDTKEFDETVKYEGRGAFVNNYMAGKYFIAPLMDGEIYKLPEDRFITVTDSFYRKAQNYFTSYFSQPHESNQWIKFFIEEEDYNLQYDWATNRMSYPSLHQYLNRLSTPTKLSPAYYAFLDKVNIYAPEAMRSISYQDFVADYVDRDVRKIIAADTTHTFRQMKEMFIDELPATIGEFVHAEWIYGLFTEENEVEVGKQQLSLFKTKYPGSKYTEILSTTLSKSEALSPGSFAPDFTCTDLQGKPVSLSDFRGKVVYLDMWATWCGPCRLEIPHAITLEEEFRNDDIVFLAVSLDDSEKEWRDFIKKKKMTGVHVISKGNFSSDVAQLYNVKGIPQYFIIGRDGKIVDSNAKRPSGGVKEDLEKLLD